MSGKCNCKNNSCGCNSKKHSQSNLNASAEEGCHKNEVPNPKTATNNQW